MVGSEGGYAVPPADKHTAFDTAHPAVPAVYLAFTLAFTMFSFQPVLIALSLAGALAYGCCARGVRETLAGLRWQLPVVAVIALLNPIFSASGSTELFRLGVRAVYLESLCYGAAMGALFIASASWLRAAASLLSFDRVMALFGNAAPVIALMVSMTMRLIPRFLRRGDAVLAAQRAVAVPGRTRGELVRERLRLSSVLMGWGMEDSLETADAMRARGWGGAPRRTTFSRYRFTRADAWALAGLLAGGAAVGLLAWAATSQYSFFPVMSRLVPWWGYVPYAAWMLLPAALHLCERRRFA